LSQELPEIRPEEIEQMAKLLADVFVQSYSQTQPVELTCTYQLVEEEKICLDAIASFQAGVLDPLGQLRDWFVSVFNSVASWVASAITAFIERAVIPSINAISDFLNRVILPAIESVIGSISRAISDTVSATGKILLESLGALGKTVTDALSSSVKTLSNLLASVGKTILDSISAAFKSIVDLLSGIGKTIMDTLSAAVKSLSDAFKSIGKTILDSLAGFANNIIDAFKSIGKTVMDALSGAAKSIIDYFSVAFKSIVDLLSGILKGIMDALHGVAEVFIDALTVMGRSILDALSAGVKALSDFFSNIAKSIMDGFSKIDKGLVDLWNFMVGAFKDIAGIISVGFSEIGRAFMGFVNGVIEAGAWITSAIKRIGEYIWIGLPESIRLGLEHLFELIQKIVRYMTEGVEPGWEFTSSPPLVLGVRLILPKSEFPVFFCTPSSLFAPLVNALVGVYEAYIQPALTSITQTIWSGIQTLQEFFANAIRAVWGSAQKVFSGLAEFLGSSITGFLGGLWEVFSRLSSILRGVFEAILGGLHEQVGKYMGRQAAPLLTEVAKSIGIGTPEYLKAENIETQIMNMYTMAWVFLSSPLWASIPVRLAAHGMYQAGQALYNIQEPIHLSLRPFGIGIDIPISITKAIGASLSHFSREVKEWVDIVGSAMVYGMGIWVSQPISRVLSYSLRNVLPVELPSLDLVMEAARRSMPSAAYEDMLKLSKYYLSLYGYSDLVIDLLFASVDRYHVVVKDRFGVERKIPLSLIYELPSASDVATMMVRDIFASIADFYTLYKARGMAEDVGALYYLLRFRYPSPERLWQFTTRGISGLLWVTMTDAERADIEKEAKDIGAYTPVAPSMLNFKVQDLMRALKTYMKWHDYAKFSWLQGFTSDNMIYIDTLADIPTKIDQRWMIKWGIYEQLSAKGVTYTSPVNEFITRYVELTPTSRITLDLTNFCRTLQATGLHPAWVPATAVAEAMNALSEERTLLRTGFVNIFKEGFWDIKAIDKFLAGFITASFKVAYIDMATMSWSEKWVNQPVMYLPPERKLIELRALMDRALDILKEIQKDIAVGYQEYIIATYDEFKSKLTGVIERVNKFFAEDYKQITGLELPDELKLSFVEAYYKPYVESLDIWREVYTVRRIRMWTQRWLGWLMYRVATGVVTRVEMSRLIDTVVKYSRLTGVEREFLYEVMNIMFGIAVKDYAVTPTQLASLSEYIVIPDELIEACFEARLIPEEWRGVWRQYISVRPIADDVKALLSVYRRAMLYVKIPDEIDKAVKEYAKLIGFTDREMAIMHLRNQLEELILNSREYIPTPSMLASICEYIPEARRFFDDVMKAKRVPKEWQEVWSKYIDIKPLVDDIKRYLSRAEQLYASFMISSREFEKVLNEVSGLLGYTPKELEFLRKVTDYERYRRAWTELIGTVDRLVELSEYSPKASKYALGKVKEMIDALPLPYADKQELKEMWEEYIRNRPVKPEARMYITQLINLYVDGLISDIDLEKELNEMKKWGFSDDEIMFYKAQAALRRARKLRIPVTYPE